MPWGSGSTGSFGLGGWEGSGNVSGTSGMSGASSAGASYGGSGFGTSSYGSGSTAGGSTGTVGGYSDAGNTWGGGNSWDGGSGGGWGSYDSSPIGGGDSASWGSGGGSDAYGGWGSGNTGQDAFNAALGGPLSASPGGYVAQPSQPESLMFGAIPSAMHPSFGTLPELNSLMFGGNPLGGMPGMSPDVANSMLGFSVPTEASQAVPGMDQQRTGLASFDMPTSFQPEMPDPAAAMALASMFSRPSARSVMDEELVPDIAEYEGMHAAFPGEFIGMSPQPMSFATNPGSAFGVQSTAINPLGVNVQSGMMPNAISQEIDHQVQAAQTAGMTGASSSASRMGFSRPSFFAPDASSPGNFFNTAASSGMGFGDIFGGAGLPAMARTGPMGGEGVENNAGLGMMPNAPAAMVADPVAPSFMNSVYDFFGLNQPGIDPASVRSEIGNLARAGAPDMVDRPFMASTPGMQADLQRVEQAMLDEVLQNAPPGVAATPINFDPITGVPSAAPTAMAGAFDFNPMDATGPMGGLTAPSATPQVAATSAEPAGFASMPPAVDYASMTIPGMANIDPGVILAINAMSAVQTAQPATQPAVPADAVPSSLAALPAASTKQPVTPQEKAELVEEKTTASQMLASREGQMSQEQIAAGLQAIEAARNPAEVEAALVGRRPIMDPNVASTLFGLMGGPIAGPALRALMHYDDPLSNPPIIGEGRHYGQYDSASYGSGGESYDSRMDGQREEPPAPAPAPAAPPAAANPGALSGFRRRYLGAGDDLLRYGMAPKGEREYYEPVAMAEGGRVEGRGALQRYAEGSMDGLRRFSNAIDPVRIAKEYLTPRDAAAFLPGAGIVEGGEQFGDARDRMREGDYLGAAGDYALGAFNVATDVIPATAFLPAIKRPGIRAQDVPDDLQIVRRGDGGPQMSLDMDEASRMARAREMEFTRPVYHETTPENARSLLSGGSGFDLSMGRAGASDSEMPRGVFVKSHDRPIGVAGSHSEQIPLSIRPGNELVMQDRDALRAFLRQDEQYRALSDEIARVNAHYKQMTDDLENQYVRRMPKEDTDALLAREDALLNEWAEMEDSLSRQAQGRATEFLRGGGYDSLRVAQDAGSWGRSTDTTVVLDPRNVRSRFAAFDPAKRDSSDLLASMAPIGLGSIGALQLIGSEQRD